MKVALYLRCSTDQQKTDMQMQALKRYCDVQGFEFDVFEDYYTGTKMDRPALKRLLGLVRAGKYKKFIIWKVDRLARSIKDFCNIFSELEASNCALISVSEHLDFSSPIGRFQAQMMAIIAELNAATIRENTKEGLRAAKARGVHCGRPSKEVPLDKVKELRAYGYTYETISRSLKIPKSRIVRRMIAAGYRERGCD